jgi:hypothetical protein
MKRRTIASLVVGGLLVIGVLVAGGAWFLRPSSDCFVADRIEELSTHSFLGKTYSLKLVTSGFQDKTRAVHLYEEPVSFDACGRPSREPLTTEAVDQGDGHQILRRVQVRSLQAIDVVVDEGSASESRSVPVDWTLGQ